MILLEKVDSSFGKKSSRVPLNKSKAWLQKPPVLHLPDKKGRFQLYSDTSKFTAGSALYQIQNGQAKLIAYASKRMPEEAKNYSIIELEMCHLAINIDSFVHLLKKLTLMLLLIIWPHHEKQSRTGNN